MTDINNVNENIVLDEEKELNSILQIRRDKLAAEATPAPRHDGHRVERHAPLRRPHRGGRGKASSPYGR